ncbi:MAG: hypothetical protein ACYDAQ_16405 [Mycobacteriales bacterium]
MVKAEEGRGRRRRGGFVAVTAGLLVLAAPMAAFAGSTGTVSTSLTGGSLSVVSVTNPSSPIAATVAGSGSGLLPEVQVADTTGTGDGWNTTVAVSDLTYTGTWVAQGGATPLTTATSAPYSDTLDGITYTVVAGSIALGVGSFTYTSTDAADASGSGTAAASTAVAVGTKGLTINFGTQTVSSGSTYVIHAGTQNASALMVDTSASGAVVTLVSGSSLMPTLVGGGTTITGGGVASNAYGSAVKVVDAAVGYGMGTYTASPGATFTSDINSLAGSYTAGVEYTIASGP